MKEQESMYSNLVIFLKETYDDDISKYVVGLLERNRQLEQEIKTLKKVIEALK